MSLSAIFFVCSDRAMASSAATKASFIYANEKSYVIFAISRLNSFGNSTVFLLLITPLATKL